MPRGPSSRAMLCAIARRANLGDARLAKLAPPRREAVAPVNSIVPDPRGTMRRAAACPIRKPANAPTRQQYSKSSGAMSIIDPFFFNDTATTELYTLSLHDALPISDVLLMLGRRELPGERPSLQGPMRQQVRDRKSTRLNSSHPSISYAVFCLQ